MPHIAENLHWYYKDGRPAYSVIGKDGQERPTTLRDARKLALVPSVTSIMRVAYRPGLQNWKDDQIILACLTMPWIQDEPEAHYIERIKRDSKEQASRAAEKGTQIHAWVQEGFEDTGPLPVEAIRYCVSARDTLNKECGSRYWVVEKSFATESYGGKIDLHCPDFLVDIKTTEKDLSTVKTWDEHAQQLAAYRTGLALNLNQKCGILYINANTAESRLIWIPEKELTRGLDCFMALLNYWYAQTGLGDEK